MFSVNALVWLLIPVVATCIAAWWLAQRTQTGERNDSDELSSVELEKMERALTRSRDGSTEASTVNADQGSSQ